MFSQWLNFAFAYSMYTCRLFIEFSIRKRVSRCEGLVVKIGEKPRLTDIVQFK